MNHTTFAEYARMRRAGIGGIVGQDAKNCLSLARARAEYHARDDVTIEWAPEQESYRDVYGEEPAEGFDYYCVVVRIGGRVYASLGFVDDDGSPQSREYGRMTENELLAEAFAAERGERAARDHQKCFL